MSGGVLLHGIRAVTFDAAGTLVRPHPSVGAIYAEVAAQFGAHVEPGDLDQRFRAAFHAVSKDPALLDPEARERDFWRRVVRAVFNSADTDGGPRPFEDFFDALWETFARGDRWQVFPDAIPTLRALRVRGYTLGVLSNWDGRLHRVLRELGLREHFHTVTISSEAGAEKPDRAIFDTALRTLGVGAGACLHVGDSRKHDLDGALGAGWRVKLVRHDDHACGEHEMRSLAALLDLLPPLN